MQKNWLVHSVWFSNYANLLHLKNNCSCRHSMVSTFQLKYPEDIFPTHSNPMQRKTSKSQQVESCSQLKLARALVGVEVPHHHWLECHIHLKDHRQQPKPATENKKNMQSKWYFKTNENRKKIWMYVIEKLRRRKKTRVHLSCVWLVPLNLGLPRHSRREGK